MKIGYFLSSEETALAGLVRQATLAERAGFDELYIQQVGRGHERLFELYAEQILPQFNGTCSSDGAAAHAHLSAGDDRRRRDAVTRVGRARLSPAGPLAVTVHGDVERLTDGSHPLVSQPSQPLDKHRDRNALDRVEVDSRSQRDRVAVRLDDDLARETSNRRRTRRDERASQPWDCRIAREHDDWPPADVWQLTPPELSSRWDGARGHDAAAASRNDARSPHASGFSGGVVS